MPAYTVFSRARVEDLVHDVQTDGRPGIIELRLCCDHTWVWGRVEDGLSTTCLRCLAL